jgi:MFS family permease
VALRMFNVALLVTLAMFAWRLPGVGAASVPLLATAQPWYVFSYFNGDAFPLFVATLLVAPLWRRRDGLPPDPCHSWGQVARATLLGAGVGLLILSKANYWPVLAFLGLCLLAKWHLASRTAVRLLAAAAAGGLVSVLLALDAASNLLASVWSALALAAGVGSLIAILGVVRLAHRTLRDDRRLAWPLAAALVGAAGVVVPVVAYDALLNGVPFSSARAERRQELLELAAQPGWRPSDALRGDHASLRLRAQGVSLGHVLLERRWVQRTAATFLGVYGYVNIYPPRVLIRAAALVFAGFAVVVVLLARRLAADPLASAIPPALLAGLVIVVASAVGYSWVYDFQAQGRYLLAILPMLGGALAAAGSAGCSARSLRLAVVAAYTLALLSFVLVALPSLPKTPSPYGVATGRESR